MKSLILRSYTNPERATVCGSRHYVLHQVVWPIKCLLSSGSVSHVPWKIFIATWRPICSSSHAVPSTCSQYGQTYRPRQALGAGPYWPHVEQIQFHIASGDVSMWRATISRTRLAPCALPLTQIEFNTRQRSRRANPAGGTAVDYNSIALGEIPCPTLQAWLHCSNLESLLCLTSLTVEIGLSKMITLFSPPCWGINASEMVWQKVAYRAIWRKMDPLSWIKLGNHWVR